MTADSTERLRERIRLCAPALHIDSIRIVEEGWDSRVAVVNEAWIFRFPRNATTARQLRIEQALLPRIAPRLPLAIPNFCYACPAITADEQPFVGYQKIPGIQLQRSVLDAANPMTWSVIARQLAEFLRALHSFSIDEARRLAPGLRNLDRAIFVAEYTEIERLVFPLLALHERERLADIYAIAADDAAWRFQPRLVHNDLTASHLLFDPAIQRVTGVIDFGDIEIGDPAIDLTGLLEYGTAFVDEVIRHYGLALDAGFHQRLRFYRLRMWLTDLRYYLHQDNDELVTARLSRLRQQIASYTM